MEKKPKQTDLKDTPEQMSLPITLKNPYKCDDCAKRYFSKAIQLKNANTYKGIVSVRIQQKIQNLTGQKLL